MNCDATGFRLPVTGDWQLEAGNIILITIRLFLFIKKLGLSTIITFAALRLFALISLTQNTENQPF
jgi:hypothetical protein